MKTLKLSLSALAAMGYLVLFTACQDDTVENDLQPTDVSEELATAQTQIPDDIQQLLRATLEDPALDFTASNARTAGSAFVYNLAITVSGTDSPGSDGEVLGQIEGTLRLREVDSIPGKNVIIADGQEFQLYSGGFEFVDDQGQMRARRASTVILEDGSSVFTMIGNLPIAQGDVLIGDGFALGEDFTAGGFVARSRRDDFIFFTADVEGDFIRGPQPPEEETPIMVGDSLVVLDVSLSVFEAVSIGGGRGDQLEELTGTLTLTRLDSGSSFPDENLPIMVTGGEEPFGDFFYEGNFELTDAEGNTVSIPAVVDASLREDFFDFLWTGVIPGTNGGFINFQSGFLPEGFETTNPEGGILVRNEQGENFFVVLSADPVAPAM